MSTTTAALLVVILRVRAGKPIVRIGNIASIVTPTITPVARAAPRSAVGREGIPTSVVTIVIIVVIPLAVASLPIPALLVT